MTREETLIKAQECVCGQREQDYGSPEDNFRTIADLWSVYKRVPFDSADVAMMMALLKIARISTGTATTDSFVDLAGYAACGAEIATTGQADRITNVNSFGEALTKGLCGGIAVSNLWSTLREGQISIEEFNGEILTLLKKEKN
jgi:hypothetical protein